MAKTNRRPSDKFERKARLAQRPQREDDFNDHDWLRAMDAAQDVDLTEEEVEDTLNS